ncbi:MAG: hypothetical protein N3I86_08250 [Verrucomicrobiae bacterium]|nr:hypothetical protein [Verrucomicrobiae bacterium]
MLAEERIANVEAALAKFIEHSERMIAAIHEDIAEIRASNARTDRQLLEMQQQAERDRQQAERDRKDFNKRLAEISDSMGTLIEDMVAPCGFNLANAIFRTEEAHTCTIRVRRKHPQRQGEWMELDLLAVGPTKLLVVEVKRRPDPEKVAAFRHKLARLPEFFPELADKTVCPAFASVYFEPSLIAFLNREKIYGIAMGDEVMEVVNLGQF